MSHLIEAHYTTMLALQPLGQFARAVPNHGKKVIDSGIEHTGHDVAWPASGDRQQAATNMGGVVEGGRVGYDAELV
ncbi:hypothetical protein [Thauera chlorobenzoica]|uniref:hypothetical protein n=1 Tax=Thauera chlorobenzoica TaxID=96773 RepID=UPI00089F90F7|nr:hypothetical protein [Thauera chlorobenzoica]SEF67435.1 hypothetical protein SAMN05216242_103244 [Thauera chlorobenzoica]